MSDYAKAMNRYFLLTGLSWKILEVERPASWDGVPVVYDQQIVQDETPDTPTIVKRDEDDKH